MDQNSSISFSFTVAAAVFVFTIIGLIGISISIYILTRDKFMKVLMFRYFLLCEIMNLIFFVYIWSWYIPILFKWNIASLYCKLWEYTGYTLYSMYQWINSLNSVDRLLSFKYSLNYDFRKKFKYQALAVAITFLFSLIINTPYYVYFDIKNSTICGFQDTEAEFYVHLLNSFCSHQL